MDFRPARLLFQEKGVVPLMLSIMFRCPNLLDPAAPRARCNALAPGIGTECAQNATALQRWHSMLRLAPTLSKTNIASQREVERPLLNLPLAAAPVLGRCLASSMQTCEKETSKPSCHVHCPPTRPFWAEKMREALSTPSGLINLFRTLRGRLWHSVKLSYLSLHFSTIVTQVVSRFHGWSPCRASSHKISPRAPVPLCKNVFTTTNAMELGLTVTSARPPSCLPV